MNIALCFYGQPRFYDITHKLYYSKILEEYTPDVFIHTWWSKEMINTVYPSARHAESALSIEDRTVKPNLIENLQSFYNPKRIQFDDYNTDKIKNHKPNHYQYYTQYAVKELLKNYEIENGIEYDLVIRTRFDLLIQQYVPYTIDDSLWVTSCCPYSDRYNDLFSFSNSKNYKKISDTYLNLEEFEQMGAGQGEMEWAFTNQTKKENIEVKKFDAEYKTFDILRTNTANSFR